MFDPNILADCTNDGLGIDVHLGFNYIDGLVRCRPSSLHKGIESEDCLIKVYDFHTLPLTSDELRVHSSEQVFEMVGLKVDSFLDLVDGLELDPSFSIRSLDSCGRNLHLRELPMIHFDTLFE